MGEVDRVQVWALAHWHGRGHANTAAMLRIDFHPKWLEGFDPSQFFVVLPNGTMHLSPALHKILPSLECRDRTPCQRPHCD